MASCALRHHVGLLCHLPSWTLVSSWASKPSCALRHLIPSDSPQPDALSRRWDVYPKGGDIRVLRHHRRPHPGQYHLHIIDTLLSDPVYLPIALQNSPLSVFSVPSALVDFPASCQSLLSSQMSPHFLRFSVQLPQFPSHSLGSLRPPRIHLVPSVLIMFSQNSSMAPRRPSNVFYRSLTHAPSRQLTRRPLPL